MNKLYCYIVLFCSLCVFAQSENDTIAVKAEKLSVNIGTDEMVHPVTFQNNFQKKYQTEDFSYETVIKTNPNSSWENFKAWLRYWLDRIFSFGGEGKMTFFEIFIKVIAVLIIGFVIYLIVRAFIRKEGMWIFGKSSKKKIKAINVMEEDIHTIDFKSIIEKNKAENNYRLSIRYYYLWLLKRMSDSQVIEWDIEKTNSDYLYEIKRDALKQEFQYLSYIYDYSWYGEFSVDNELFTKAEKAFIRTINSV